MNVLFKMWIPISNAAAVAAAAAAAAAAAVGGGGGGRGCWGKCRGSFFSCSSSCNYCCFLSLSYAYMLLGRLAFSHLSDLAFPSPSSPLLRRRAFVAVHLHHACHVYFRHEAAALMKRKNLGPGKKSRQILGLRNDDTGVERTAS